MKLARKKSQIAQGAYAWYSGADISWLRGLALAALFAGLFVGLRFSPWGAWLRAKLARPAEFQARHRMGRDPLVDPRLRILVHDDRASRYLRGGAISPSDWARLFTSIASAKPKAILLDVDPAQDWDAAAAAELGRVVKSLQFPIAVAGRIGPPAPSTSVKLPTEKEEYGLRRILKAGKYLQPDDIDTLAWIPETPASFLGTEAAAAGTWSAVGQIKYDETLEASVLARLDKETAIPFLAFFAARSRGIADNQFLLDGKSIPWHAGGRFLPNFVPAGALLPVTESLDASLETARAGTAQAIPADSIVLIAPFARVEGTPLVDSPFGRVPRVDVLAAAVNSILVGKWLTAPRWGWVTIVLASLLALLVTVPLRRMAGATLGVLVTAWLVAGGLWVFAERGIELPWLESAAACLATSLAILRTKRRAARHRTARLHHGLAGLLSPSDLARVESLAGAFSPQPATAEVTLMRVELVGLALCSDRQDADKVYADVRAILQRLAAQVHAHNGIVGRLTENGALCWFGYRHGIGETLPHHADLALSCAVAIQKESAERSLVAHRIDEPVYPFRIGIHTATVHVGDLAVRDTVDFAAVGMGVSFAEELMQASEPFCITVGATTKDRLTKFGDPNQTLKKKLVRARYGGETIEAYEHDPFWDNPQRRNEAIVAQRDFAKIDRVEMRWALPPGSVVTVSGNRGAGFLVNFSRSGLAVKFDKFLSRGVTLSLTIQIDDPKVRDDLHAQGLMPLGGEVQWARATGAGRYILGVVITSLSEEQKDKLLAVLRETLVDSKIPKMAAG